MSVETVKTWFDAVMELQLQHKYTPERIIYSVFALREPRVHKCKTFGGLEKKGAVVPASQQDA